MKKEVLQMSSCCCALRKNPVTNIRFPKGQSQKAASQHFLFRVQNSTCQPYTQNSLPPPNTPAPHSVVVPHAPSGSLRDPKLHPRFRIHSATLNTDCFLNSCSPALLGTSALSSLPAKETKPGSSCETIIALTELRATVLQAGFLGPLQLHDRLKNQLVQFFSHLKRNGRENTVLPFEFLPLTSYKKQKYPTKKKKATPQLGEESQSSHFLLHSL